MEFDILRPGVWFGPTDQADEDRLGQYFIDTVARR